VNVYSNNLTYSIETQPTSGTLELDSENGNFTYKLSPANNSLSGSTSDWFSFKVRDAKNGKESTAVVDINFKNDPFYDHQWHTSQSNASILLNNYPRKGEITHTNGISPNLNLQSVINNGTTGKGVIVAIIDNGLALDHSDLKDNLVAGGSWDFVDNDDNPGFNSNSQKVDNHGTTVAAILGAVGWNNIGFRGVAPGVSLKGFRILNNGSLNLNHEYLAAGEHTKAKDVDIFNMSYGTNATNIKNLDPSRERGFWFNANRNNARKVFIRAAGNGFKSFDTSNGKKECPLASSYNLPCGTTTMDPIADHPVIINVAAIAPDGKADENSNQGAANWISAPHGSYVSSEDCWHLADCKTARYMWGTSWAAPMVSGVVALMLETNPNLTWRDVKYILAKTAVQIDHGNQQKRPSIKIKGVNVEQGWTTNAAEFTFHNAYGFGLVDTKAAVELAKVYRSDNLGDFVKYDGLTSSTLDMSIHPNNLYESTINQSISGIIEAVKVKIYIESEHISDLSFALVSPSGTRSVILSPFNAIESIEDGYFELSSNAFYGETMQGEWKIEVYDHLIDSSKQDRSDTSNNVTRLNSWSLKLYGHDKN
jgi:subtilisin family serine protease/subtilisin-like proprotein convertase family protein